VPKTRGDYTTQFKTDGAAPGGDDEDEEDDDESHRVKEDLFAFIPTDRTMPDFLHLHLRIGERLLHLACMKILAAADKTEDMDDPERKTQAKFLYSELHDEFEEHAKQDVTFVKRDGTWQTSPKLTGNRLRPLLKKINFNNVPSLAKPECQAIRKGLQSCFATFVALHDEINRPDPFGKKDSATDGHRKKGATAFKKRVVKWIHAACGSSAEQGGFWQRRKWKHKGKAGLPAEEVLTLPGLFPKKKMMTPYVHLLAFHIPFLLAKWGDLYEFGGQEFEKQNNVHNLIWFRCSSRKGDAWGKPILKHTLRNLYNFEGDGRAPWRCYVIGCGAKYTGSSGQTLANHLEKVHLSEDRLTAEEEAKVLTKHRAARQQQMNIRAALKRDVRAKAVPVFKRMREETNKKARDARAAKRRKAEKQDSAVPDR
jgi:hypothetical protein